MIIIKSGWNKNLYILLSGQLVSQVGDKFYMLALSYWTLETTGSPAIMGLVMACALLPSLGLGFISGAFIDKYDRKTIIVLTDMIRGMIISIVTVAFFLNALTIAMVMIAQVALSVNAAFFDPAIPSILPQIVTEDQLTKANSKTQFISGFSSIMGPILGGVAVAALGYAFVFVFNAVSFFVSGLFECFLELPKINRTNRQATTITQDIIDGYRYIIFDRGLIIIIFMVSVIHFFVGSIEVVIPVFAVQLDGGGAENIGFIQASLGIGSVFMAFLISIYSINQREVGFLFGSVFFIGLTFIAIAVLSSIGINRVVPFIFIFLSIGSLIILAGTSFRSILQKTVDNSMAGRVFSVVGSVGNGSIPLAMIIYGILLTHIQFYILLIVSGIILLPVSILCYYSFKGAAHVRGYQSGTGSNRYKDRKKIIKSS